MLPALFPQLMRAVNTSSVTEGLGWDKIRDIAEVQSLTLKNFSNMG
jgi:hypothetical protein